jgi:hypothetical protein
MSGIYTTSFPKENIYLEDDTPKVLTNHTGYEHDNSANLEHDDTGCQSNYSGCADTLYSAEAEHSGCEEGYDF